MENYKDIELSHKQIRILKKIRKKEIIISTPKLEDCLLFFSDLNLIKCVNEQNIFYMKENQRKYSLTDTGKMYLQFCKKDMLRTWYPHIVSTVSVITSVLAFVCSIISLVMQNLKLTQ